MTDGKKSKKTTEIPAKEEPFEFDPMNRLVSFHDVNGKPFKGTVVFLSDGWLFLKTVGTAAETKEPDAVLGFPVWKIAPPIKVL